MINGLSCRFEFAVGRDGVSGVMIWGKSRKAAAGYFKPDPMAWKKDIGSSFHVDFDLTGFARRHHNFAIQALPESHSEDTVAKINGSPVLENIAKPANKIGIDCS